MIAAKRPAGTLRHAFGEILPQRLAARRRGKCDNTFSTTIAHAMSTTAVPPVLLALSALLAGCAGLAPPAAPAGAGDFASFVVLG
ncbi:hypothetical protein CSQ96_22470, partial [Janthinobacterium sp. BJB412]